MSRTLSALAIGALTAGAVALVAPSAQAAQAYEPCPIAGQTLRDQNLVCAWGGNGNVWLPIGGKQPGINKR
ncbi:hypothetical protein [Nocardia brasiliensis]|uniref:Secreted protein n=1 Tax=Nocardia brasiliensis (strain ATCC 700358 / HUJEG-1) TaxID=1133849 RepID=K0EQF9_NOCB7|nr:hypothetical protein [Nocardia brasiliensis]AFT99064.1 hypothetical protein O3I_005510 [Nocardia brasiliensis ATCC 700358]OCF87227.1 hypothetical protein AW168_27700 [Nocardia brasiliensis]